MPITEREPELFWTDVSDSEWQAQDAPWSAGLLASLARNTECHKRALYGLGSYLGDVPHDHQTGESAHLSPAVGANLVQASCPAVTAGSSRPDVWAASGFKIQKLISIWQLWTGEDTRTVEGAGRGAYVTQTLLALPRGRQSELFGGGTDLVCGVFARAKDTVERGTMQFGLSGAQTGQAILDADDSLEVTSPGEFGPRSSGVIHYTDLSTSWARFFIRIANAGANIVGDVKLTLSILQGFDEKIEVTGFTVTQGRRLYWWAPGAGDVPTTPYSFGHAGWQNMPIDVPLLDYAVSMQNAVELEPI